MISTMKTTCQCLVLLKIRYTYSRNPTQLLCNVLDLIWSCWRCICKKTIPLLILFNIKLTQNSNFMRARTYTFVRLDKGKPFGISRFFVLFADKITLKAKHQNSWAMLGEISSKRNPLNAFKEHIFHNLGNLRERERETYTHGFSNCWVYSWLTISQHSKTFRYSGSLWGESISCFKSWAFPRVSFLQP